MTRTFIFLDMVVEPVILAESVLRFYMLYDPDNIQNGYGHHDLPGTEIY